MGGGARPRPGEITLAHRGVLFLDELAEFSRAALEALRQPLEDGSVEIVRGQRAVTLPRAVHAHRSLQPLPCARAPEACTCDEIDRERYQRRLSGPLLDRIDLVCQVSAPPAGRADGPAPVGRGELVGAFARA